MNVKIVEATQGNIEKANEFLTRLIRDEKRYDSNINEACVVNSLYESLYNDESNCILFAEVNDEIVGYLYGYIQENSDAYIHKISKLEAMFIDEDNRGFKIGQKLIKKFKIWSKNQNCKYIELSVCNDNRIAFGLYKKEGFNEIKTIMSLELR